MLLFLLGVGVGLLLAFVSRWLFERLGRHWDTRGDIDKKWKHKDPYSWD